MGLAMTYEWCKIKNILKVVLVAPDEEKNLIRAVLSPPFSRET